MILKINLTNVDLSKEIVRGVKSVVTLINDALIQAYTQHITGENGDIPWEGFVRLFREDGGVELLNYSKRAFVSREEDIQILNEILDARGNGVKITFSQEYP